MSIRLGRSLGSWVLKSIAKKPAAGGGKEMDADIRASGATKLERFFGTDFWDRLAGATVLDYGCGTGREAVALASRGAERVFGTDVSERSLQAAQGLASEQGVADRCVFLNARTERDRIRALRGRIDLAYSLDSFEHFLQPAVVLDEIHGLLAPEARLLVSFGPPWKHPYGCHMQFISSLPWLHYLFSEETIMSVRALYRSDGARRFEEVEGGLNRMTVARFQQLVERSAFDVELFRPVAIRNQEWLTRNRVLREYFTSVVTCILVKPAVVSSACPE